MRNKVVIIMCSILVSMMFMSSGYGYWQKSLTIVIEIDEKVEQMSIREEIEGNEKEVSNLPIKKELATSNKDFFDYSSINDGEEEQEEQEEQEEFDEAEADKNNNGRSSQIDKLEDSIKPHSDDIENIVDEKE